MWSKLKTWRGFPVCRLHACDPIFETSKWKKWKSFDDIFALYVSRHYRILFNSFIAFIWSEENKTKFQRFYEFLIRNTAAMAYCHSSSSIIIIVQHKRIQINWNPTHLCGFVFERPGEIWRKEKKVFNEDSLLFDKVGKIGCVYAIQV